MENLAIDPDDADVKMCLRTELQRWVTEQSDTGASMDTPQAQTANRAANAKQPPLRQKSGRRD